MCTVVVMGLLALMVTISMAQIAEEKGGRANPWPNSLIFDALPPVDCEDLHMRVPSLPSGVYTIVPPNRSPIVVYCDMDYLGGGWTVFHRRIDGTQDFFLKWDDYKKGFGNLSGNFWLGNDKIRWLTSGKYDYHLLVTLTNKQGTTGYAFYEGFRVDDEIQRYALRLRSFKADKNHVGDSLTIHNDMRFSTIDSDSDANPRRNCAKQYQGAWWYKDCHRTNLNAVYEASGDNGLVWNSWLPAQPMKTASMMIRRSEAFHPSCISNARFITGYDFEAARPIDCEDLHYKSPCLPSGVYPIFPANRSSIVVYCEMTYLGGGWTVIQRRVDANQDFALKWDDYKKGFGDLTTNFWLGNDNIHWLTTGRYEYNLLVALVAEDGNTGYAFYDGFRIENEAQRYKLRVQRFRSDGNKIGDSLTSHNNAKFSTIDSDSDADFRRNCASQYDGAWWYTKCHTSNLNGRYGATNGKGLCWNSWRPDESMRTTAMMIRRSAL